MALEKEIQTEQSQLVPPIEWAPVTALWMEVPTAPR
jgi:hypothetical protein